MPRSHTCSVIIPTYNRARLLGYTLDSLVRQDLPRDDFEVLVVDDGSTDSTETVVHSYRGRLAIRYFFQPDEGFRAAAARNVGITNASGDICVFVDSGVLLHSSCLRQHLASHHATVGPAAVCGYVYCFNLDNEDAAQIRRSIDVTDTDGSIAALQATGHWPDVREPFYARFTDDFHAVPAPWYVYWTCNASARTDQVRAVGAFDEMFRRWGAEDIDLGYRLHRDGARFMVNRLASGLHYPHDKVYEELADAALENYQYIARKYGTPITNLLDAVPTPGFIEINDVIRDRRLPSCAEYRNQLAMAPARVRSTDRPLKTMM
jgi:glycosyltransferase involved in cell wall biosynthesis